MGYSSLQVALTAFNKGKLKVGFNCIACTFRRLLRPRFSGTKMLNCDPMNNSSHMTRCSKFKKRVIGPVTCDFRLSQETDSQRCWRSVWTPDKMGMHIFDSWIFSSLESNLAFVSIESRASWHLMVKSQTWQHRCFGFGSDVKVFHSLILWNKKNNLSTHP